MDIWSLLTLSFVLRLTRASAFIAAAPILGSTAVPSVVKVGLAMLLAVFFSIIFPINLEPDVAPLAAGLMVAQEAIVGLALALVARLVYMAVQQGGMILAQQMGLSDAEAIDPISGEPNEAIASVLEMIFAILFLGGGGLQLLISVLAKSQTAFPVGAMPDVTMLTQAIVTAGSAMLLLGLKLAAPAVAAFVILSVVLAVLARILPDMNILMESYPLRMGLGLAMAASIMPLMGQFTSDLASWMSRAFTG